MVKCEGILHLINRDLDGDLTPNEQEQLHQHLATCTSCQQDYEQLTQLSQQLAVLPKVNPSVSIVDRMLPELDKLEEEQFVGTRKFKSKYVWMSSVGVAAALLFMIWFTNGFGLNGSFDDEAGFEMMNAENSAINGAENEVSVLESASEQQDMDMDGQEFVSPEPDMREDQDITDGNELLTREDEPSTESESDDSMARKYDQDSEVIASPQGTYTAYLGYGLDDIRIEKDGEAYMLSTNVQSPLWEVQELKWLNDHELYYILYHIREELTEYWVIDAEERTETEVDGPIE